MNKTVQFPGAVRFLSLLLALAMVFSMVPPTHVHATEVTLEVADAEGNPADTFVVGDPIYVTATSDTAGDFIGMYSLEDPSSGEWFWYYIDGSASKFGRSWTWTNGQTYNIYSTVPWEGSGEAKTLPAGQYILSADSLPEAQKIITIVEPEDADYISLEVESDTIAAGSSLKYTATSYKSGNWVGLYSGTKTTSSSYGNDYVYFAYNNGYNGTWNEIKINKPGDYTLVLFGDDGYGKAEKVIPITVTGEEAKIISTDKDTYAMGEAINVTVNTEKYTLGAKDWVGLSYRNKIPNGTTVTSFYYYYPAASGTTFNLLEGIAQNAGSMVPGEYTVYFLANDGYSVIDSVDITITEKQEAKREVKAPTCEDDGYTLITYTDGSTEKVDTKTKLGHDWSDYVYDGADKKTHTESCKRDNCGETRTNDCSFDAGVATKEPSATENGIMTYTCEVCEGTYTQEITNKEIKSEEVTKEPTCEEHGVKRVTYVDDTYIDFPVQKLGHNYGDWTYDEDTLTHYKTCANDKKQDHVISEECDFSSSLKDGTITYTCDVCKGSYSETALIYTDKTVYDYNEPIMVSTNFEVGEKDWIGLYKLNDRYNPDEGGLPSIVWYYPADEENPFNILDGTPDATRGEDHGAGEYILVAFKDDGYEVIATYRITITATETGREEVKATCEEAGYLKITYSDGTEKVTTYPKLGHKYGTKLSFIEASRTHAYVCGNDATHVKNEEKCTFDEGVVVTEATGDQPGVKEYTCSVCGGKYQEAFFNKEIKSEGVYKEPGCMTQGIYRYTYVDGTYLDVPIPQTGHDYPTTWTPDTDNDQHIKVCKNDSTHILKEACTYSSGVQSGTQVTYTCSVCNGQKVTSVLHTSKDTYVLGEYIDVLAYNTNDMSWVGLYRRDEAPGDIVSMYWFYVKNASSGIDRSGVVQNMIDTGYLNTDRADGLTPGDYSILLFKDGGYTSCIAVKEITIIEGDEESTYDFKVNGEAVENGQELNFKDGEAIKVNATAEGFVGLSWIGVYASRTNIDADFSSFTSDYWWYIKDYNGKDVNISRAMGMEAGDYTVVLFADGGHSRPMKYVNISIEKEKANSVIVTEPTCVNYGVEFVTYDDGTTAYEVIDPLGHLYEDGKFEYDEEKHTHTQLCGRCNKVITERCKLDKGVIVEEATASKPGTKKFTCQVCGNSYLEKYELEAERPTDVSRVHGETRFETAISIANKMKQVRGIEKFDTIIIADGSNFADALSGSYLAVQKNAPILLAYKHDQNVQTADYVKANLADGGKVYILGGTAAVSEEMETLLAGITVTRLAGENRFETNLLILKEAGVNGGELIVCTGRNFADALSASAAGKPILLVNKELYDSQKTFVSGINVKKVYIIGGETAINFGIENTLRNLTDSPSMRIGGANRYVTSVKIAETFFGGQFTAVLAYGLNFPDGLCGGPLAYAMGAPLVLAQDRFVDTTIGFAEDNEILSGVVLGGSNLITNTMARSIFQMAAGNSIVDFKN